jgi:hypothetical protein
MPFYSTMSPADRFWSKVDRNGTTPAHMPELGPCWTWRAAVNRGGYGQFWVHGRQSMAHRFAWETINGPIPQGLLVLHRCDNPPCCNPVHLRLGTQAENAADCITKGRRASGPEHNARFREARPRGVSHPAAVLTDEDVLAIRTTYTTGGLSQTLIAQRFGISQQQVSRLVLRQSWTHT